MEYFDFTIFFSIPEMEITRDVEIKEEQKIGTKNETFSISEKLDRLTSIVEENQNQINYMKWWLFCSQSYPVKNIENKTYTIPRPWLNESSSTLDGWTFGNYRTVIFDNISKLLNFRLKCIIRKS